MRKFLEIEKELGLKKFLGSDLGTLYFVPTKKGSKRVIVRRFDSLIPPTTVNEYVDIISRCHSIVERIDELNKFVFIEIPFEVGTDYYARKHHTYFTSLDSYETENDIDIPNELGQMRSTLEHFLNTPEIADDLTACEVLRRSLMGPSSKTYFDNTTEKFIVVEPVILVKDVLNDTVTS